MIFIRGWPFKDGFATNLDDRRAGAKANYVHDHLLVIPCDCYRQVVVREHFCGEGNFRFYQGGLSWGLDCGCACWELLEEEGKNGMGG